MNSSTHRWKDSRTANPLEAAIYERETLINNIEIFISCTVSTFQKRSNEAVKLILEYADQLDQVAKTCDKVERYTNMTKAICGAGTIGSLLSIPLTGVNSMYAVLGTSVVGAIAFIVNKNSSGATLRCEDDFGEKAKVASERVIKIIKTFHKVLVDYDDVLTKAKKYLKTDEGITLLMVLKTSNEPSEITLKSFIAKAIKTFGSKTKLVQFVLCIGEYGVASASAMASSAFLSLAIDESGLGIWKLFDQNLAKPKTSLFALKLREFAKGIGDSTEMLIARYKNSSKLMNESKVESAQHPGGSVPEILNVAVPTDRNDLKDPENYAKCSKKPTDSIESVVPPKAVVPDELRVSNSAYEYDYTQLNKCNKNTIAVTHDTRAQTIQAKDSRPNKSAVSAATLFQALRSSCTELARTIRSQNVFLGKLGVFATTRPIMTGSNVQPQVATLHCGTDLMPK